MHVKLGYFELDFELKLLFFLNKGMHNLVKAMHQSLQKRRILGSVGRAGALSGLDEGVNGTVHTQRELAIIIGVLLKHAILEYSHCLLY